LFFSSLAANSAGLSAVTASVEMFAFSKAITACEKD
jgi:hypothetical protein